MHLCIFVFVCLCICRVAVVARVHKGVRVDTKIVLNWLLASSTATAPTTSQIGVNFKQTEHEERVG